MKTVLEGHRKRLRPTLSGWPALVHALANAYWLKADLQTRSSRNGQAFERCVDGRVHPLRELLLCETCRDARLDDRMGERQLRRELQVSLPVIFVLHPKFGGYGTANPIIFGYPNHLTAKRWSPTWVHGRQVEYQDRRVRIIWGQAKLAWRGPPAMMSGRPRGQATQTPGRPGRRQKSTGYPRPHHELQATFEIKHVQHQRVELRI